MPASAVQSTSGLVPAAVVVDELWLCEKKNECHFHQIDADVCLWASIFNLQVVLAPALAIGPGIQT